MSAHEGGNAHRGPHIIGKDKECADKGNHSSVERHAVRNCTHRVFPDTEVHVPTTVTPFTAYRAGDILRSGSGRLKISESLKPCESGRIQVGCSPHKFRHPGRKCLQNRLRCLPGGESLQISTEFREGRFPVHGQSSIYHTFKFRGIFRIGFPVTFKGGSPLRFLFPSPLYGTAHMFQDILRHKKFRLHRPAKISLGGGNLLHSERRSVTGGIALLGGRSITYYRAYADYRRTRLFFLCETDRPVYRVHIVAVFNMLHMPAGRFKPFPNVLGK